MHNERGRALGVALWSPSSEIALRLLDRNPAASLDENWWRTRLASAIARRQPITKSATAYRLVHGEGDACPSLICDRYDRWLVIQLMSAGIEQYRGEIVALADVGQGHGVELLSGQVPREIEVVEHGVRYLAAPGDGQKTGAFLDQRENRISAAALARGRALDCFSYHGSFAIHLAGRADSVVALDVSADALRRAARNCELNALTNGELVEANAFEFLKTQQRSRVHFETIVLDPPAFAKTKASLPSAIRGYKEINLRAMQLLSPGGNLLTASCSFHLTIPLFLAMLRAAAADSGRRLALRELRTQPLDHPGIVNVPETIYLKSAVLEAVD